MVNLPTKKVQVVVFRRTATDVLFLILQRLDGVEGQTGMWQSITGGVEHTDASLQDAALRELKEETGIAQVIALHGPVFDFSFAGVSGPTTEYVFAVEVGDVQVRLDQNVYVEHQAFAWLSCEQAIEKVYWDTAKDALRRVYNDVVSKP